MAMDGLAELLGNCWIVGRPWRDVGRSWSGLGCDVRAQDGSEIWRLLEKVLLQEAGGSTAVFDGFCVEDKQPWRPQNLYLWQGIPMANAYRRFHDLQNFWFLLGANMAPCWLP